MVDDPAEVAERTEQTVQQHKGLAFALLDEPEIPVLFDCEFHLRWLRVRLLK
jgi:hypothetical protein